MTKHRKAYIDGVVALTVILTIVSLILAIPSTISTWKQGNYAKIQTICSAPTHAQKYDRMCDKYFKRK